MITNEDCAKAPACYWRNLDLLLTVLIERHLGPCVEFDFVCFLCIVVLFILFLAKSVIASNILEGVREEVWVGMSGLVFGVLHGDVWGCPKIFQHPPNNVPPTDAVVVA